MKFSFFLALLCSSVVIGCQSKDPNSAKADRVLAQSTPEQKKIECRSKSIQSLENLDFLFQDSRESSIDDVASSFNTEIRNSNFQQNDRWIFWDAEQKAVSEIAIEKWRKSGPFAIVLTQKLIKNGNDIIRENTWKSVQNGNLDKIFIQKFSLDLEACQSQLIETQIFRFQIKAGVPHPLLKVQWNKRGLSGAEKSQSWEIEHLATGNAWEEAGPLTDSKISALRQSVAWAPILAEDSSWPDTRIQVNADGAASYLHPLTGASVPTRKFTMQFFLDSTLVETRTIHIGTASRASAGLSVQSSDRGDKIHIPQNLWSNLGF